MIEFIEKYWTYLVAIGTVTTYLFEKGRTIWLEKRAKKNSYNRLFTAVLKLYISFLKHSELYAEKPPMNLPDEIYIQLLKHLDTFNSDLNGFKETVDNESEIVPEIIIQTHLLFEAIDRIRIVDRMQVLSTESPFQISDNDNIGIKRAQFYAMKETYDKFFNDIISDLQRKTIASKKFINRIKYFKTDEYKDEIAEEQTNNIERYFESLHRQGLISDELHNIFLKEFVMK